MLPKIKVPFSYIFSTNIGQSLLSILIIGKSLSVLFRWQSDLTLLQTEWYFDINSTQSKQHFCHFSDSSMQGIFLLAACCVKIVLENIIIKSQCFIIFKVIDTIGDQIIMFCLFVCFLFFFVCLFFIYD